MADTGVDGSPSPQDLLDSSPSDIKLFLGTQVPGGQEVTVSRAALEDMSPVFKNMLTHNMVERIQGQVRLEKVSMETWNVISTFYFSGEDRVCMGNVEEIVSVADMYELTKLKDHCDAFLCKYSVCGDDLAEVLNWASFFTMAKLKEKHLKVVRDNFMDLCQSESFLRLSRDVLLEILCGPYVVGDEHAVCLAVMRWLDAQNADHQTTGQLFQHLKLNEVCLCCLEKHVAECENATVRDVVLCLVETEKQAKEMGSVGRPPAQYFLVSDRRGYRRLFPNKVDQAFGRMCMCACPREHNLIFVGVDEVHVNSLKVGTMNVNGKLTVSSTSPSKRRVVQHVACVFDNCVFLIVGRYSSTCIYDLRRRVWSEGPQLREQRHYHALVAMGDALYAVMGLGPNGPLSSIETYSVLCREWRFAGHMQQATCHVCAANVGSLIIASGVTLTRQNFLQCFNTETKVAVILESTSGTPRCLEAFSFGSDGVVFVQEDETMTVCLNRYGQLSISKEQLPNLKCVFEVEEASCTDNHTTPSEQPCSELEKLTSWEIRVPHFVQHDLAGGRANLTPFPALTDKDVTFLLTHDFDGLDLPRSSFGSDDDSDD